MSVNTWLKLLLAGAYTFTLAGLLIGTYGALMHSTELPEGTSPTGAILWVLGAVGAAIVLGILAFQAVMGVGRALGF